MLACISMEINAEFTIYITCELYVKKHLLVCINDRKTEVEYALQRSLGSKSGMCLHTDILWKVGTAI